MVSPGMGGYHGTALTETSFEAEGGAAGTGAEAAGGLGAGWTEEGYGRRAISKSGSQSSAGWAQMPRAHCRRIYKNSARMKEFDEQRALAHGPILSTWALRGQLRRQLRLSAYKYRELRLPQAPYHPKSKLHNFSHPPELSFHLSPTAKPILWWGTHHLAPPASPVLLHVSPAPHLRPSPPPHPLLTATMSIPNEALQKVSSHRFSRRSAAPPLQKHHHLHRPPS